MDLIEQIEAYTPFNEQEERDRELILTCLRNMPDIFERKNTLAHMTASAWVVNPERTRVLMAYHKIYDSWSWLGGHADGEKDLLQVALREVKEESGVTGVRPVTEDIFSLESLTVDGHVKKGNYVSSHIHLNVTYLLEAGEEDTLSVKEDENSGVAWFDLQEAVEASSEPWFREHIYTKLNRKLLLSEHREEQKEAEMGDWPAELARRALRARKKAYTPYSGFAVGAALLTAQGNIYEGCNIENASFTPTNCAERTAIFKAVSEGCREFSAIAVAGGLAGKEPEDFCIPCGVCLQVMSEFCSPDFPVCLVKSPAEVRLMRLGELLPVKFEGMEQK